MILIITFRCYWIITLSHDTALESHCITKKSYPYFENRDVTGSLKFHIWFLNTKKK